MTKHKKTIILTVFALGILLLILGGSIKFNIFSGNKIQGVPKEVNQFLNNQDVQKHIEQDFTIYRGDNPPNIEGSYLLNNLTLVYDPQTWKNTYPIGYVIAPYIYRFSNQTLEGKIDFSYSSNEVDDKAEGLQGFISGENNCFTVFINQQGEYIDCNYNQPKLFSACIVNNKLTQVQDSWFLKYKKGASCEEHVMPLGYLRIYEEKDGTGERQ